MVGRSRKASDAGVKDHMRQPSDIDDTSHDSIQVVLGPRHRPSPLILPPGSMRDYEARERERDRERVREQDGAKGTLQGQKRSLPFDSNEGGRAAVRRGSGQQASDDGGDDDDEVNSSGNRPRQNSSNSNNDEGHMGRRRGSDEAEGELKRSPFPFLGMHTPSGASDIPQRDSVCFCVRAPKVPRPRNAFILYRQHFQSQVVAQHPGLANPEISKIIGQMWKDQPPDVKNGWKQLAEEEKIRHRLQYPDYRYQPRRAGKAGNDGSSGSGGRPGSAAGQNEAGFDGGVGNHGEGDPNRCEKCGGRYLAPLSSARSIPSSAKMAPPSSPYGNLRSGSESGGSSSNQQGRFPGSPKSAKMSASSGGTNSNIGRRPLPYHNYAGDGHREDRGEDVDMANAAGYPTQQYAVDQKRRRYDLPTPYTSRFPSQHNHRMHNHGGLSPAPPPPPLPLPSSSHPRSHSQTPELASLTGLQTPWMAPPTLPLRQPGQSSYVPSEESPYPVTPRLGPGRGEAYGGPMSARLPPIQSGYGYYNGLPSSRSTTGGGSSNMMAAPATAMANLSMRPVPPAAAVAINMSTRIKPGAATPTTDNNRGSTSSSSREHQARHGASAGFADESLKLPPLVTATAGQAGSTSSTAWQHQQPQQLHMTGTRMHAMRTFAMAPAPASLSAAASSASSAAETALAKNRGGGASRDDVDKDSQTSGIRAMVMSVPYLNKLEVMRRITPPQPLVPRRGPIIAIEGHSPELVRAVGQAIERALVQSGECAVRTWATDVKLATESAEKTDTSTDDVLMGGMAPSPASASDDGSSSGGDGQRNAAHSPVANLLMAYHELIMSWHSKSRDILRYITGRGDQRSAMVAAAAVKAASPTVGLSPAQAPSPAKSTSPMPTLTIDTGANNAPLSSAGKTGAGSASVSPHPSTDELRDTNGVSATTSECAATATRPALPVALITGGYSLAASDHYAMTVPIDDAFPPIGHWEWMATLWRGIAGPDLVVYADSRPPASGGSDEQLVNTRAQEGVIVVHTAAEGQGEGSDQLDKKTERRLVFEVLEWVRSGSFGSS